MATPTFRPDRYVFGRFCLNGGGTLLTRDGEAVPLAPKVLQTLLVLVQRAGDVVAKEDLLAAVWPQTFVEETGLTRNISLLRRALGDEGDRLVVTIPSIGYRFTGSVATTTAPVSEDADTVIGDGQFVGRLAELARLQGAWRRTREGRGALIAISGEPGIGKTTLARRFLSLAAKNGLTGLGRCSERFGTAEPHLPVLECLEMLADDSATAHALARLAPTWSQHVGRVTGGPATSTQAGSPEHLLRELTQFLAEASRHRPIVWLLDDAHWADTATSDVIGHLASRLPHLRVLLVLTYRDRVLEQSEHPLATIRAESLAKGLLEEVTLPPLTREEVSTYVSLARPQQDVGLSEQVFERSEGNPLFMSALVGYLIELETGDGAGTARDGIPDSLRGLITRLLQQLDARHRQVLDAAALLGYAFNADVLAHALDSDPLALEDLLHDSERLHGLVWRERQASGGQGTSGAVYRFRHALYQSALLEQLSPSRRARLAGALAGALSARQRPGDRSVAGAAAMLLETARAYASAADGFAEAAAHATEMMAYKDAYQLALRGMDCLARASDLAEAERQRIELALTFAQLVPFRSSRGFGHPAVEALVQRASTLATASGDPLAAARATSETVHLRLVRGECTAARDAAHRLVTIAETAGHVLLLVNAHMQAQIACHHLGDFRDADRHASEVLRLGAPLAPPVRFINIFDPVVASYAESSRNAWITGRLATAATLADEAVALGLAVRHQDSLAFAWLFHAWVHGYKADWQTCVRSADAGIAVAQDADAVQTLAWNRCVRGWARAHLGDVTDGARELAEGLRLSQSIMGEVGLPQFRAMMAEVLLLGRDVAQARRWLSEALEAECDHDDAYFSAEIHRLAAVCDLTFDNRGPDEHLTRALAISRQQGAAFFELRAALTARARHGDAALVRDALARLPQSEPWPDVVSASREGSDHPRRAGPERDGWPSRAEHPVTRRRRRTC